MIYNQAFAEYPVVQEWGPAMSIVPLNIREFEVLDGETGKMVRMWYADVVEKVVNPITVDSIVEAAINSEFTEAEQKYIIRNIDNDSDALVKKYKALVATVKQEAKDAGYK